MIPSQGSSFTTKFTSLKILSEKAEEKEHIQAPLGYCLWENGAVIEHTHHGSSGNYECIIRIFKQDGLTIIILTNQKNSNVRKISDQILKIIKNSQ